jgi:hypothetical protein
MSRRRTLRKPRNMTSTMSTGTSTCQPWNHVDQTGAHNQTMWLQGRGWESYCHVYSQKMLPIRKRLHAIMISTHVNQQEFSTCYILQAVFSIGGVPGTHAHAVRETLGYGAHVIICLQLSPACIGGLSVRRLLTLGSQTLPMFLSGRLHVAIYSSILRPRKQPPLIAVVAQWFST